MIAVAKFAAMHVVDSADAAAWETDPTVDVALPLAGPGAPLISEAAAVELAAVLGMSTQAGKAYLGDVVELRYRLKHVWARILDGSMLAWRARKMAQQTKSLDAEVAAWVDQQLGDRAHKVGPRQLERMIVDAAALFEPDLTAAVAESPEVADHRGVRVDTSQQALLWEGAEQASGAVPLGYVDAVLDLADALDLEQAVAAIAHSLLTDEAYADTYADALPEVRRSAALGVLARAYNSGSMESVPGRARVLELVIHTDTKEVAGTGMVRVANTRGLATIEQLSLWAQVPGTVVRPVVVVDLAEEIESFGYTPTRRQRRQAELLHQKCSFPHCNARATNCDLDHRVPFGNGGHTTTSNLTPLCRRHHRAKTHQGWTYRRLRSATYLWRSPHGYAYLVTPGGTVDVSADLDPPFVTAA